MAAKFEKVSRYENENLIMPERKTAGAAGYDIAAAETVVIEPYQNIMTRLHHAQLAYGAEKGLTLDSMASLTKNIEAKPTLIPTGVKCRLDEGTYLELSVRSSCPLKYWLILANGVGIIDSDYYNNESNEGELFFQVINLSPTPLLIQKGEIIGQGIVKPYLTTEDDCAMTLRRGGFGSTTQTPGAQ